MFNSLFSTSKKIKHSQLHSNTLKNKYQELVVKHYIYNDAGQIKVLGHLQQLLNDITNIQNLKKNLSYPLISFAENHIRSIYIFGDVGHGKTLLMDVFFQVCPIKLKRRVHFHLFMQEVHDYMHQWRKNNKGDPLPSLAKNIKNHSQLLCLDEFQVTDIADAMLLSRLFTQLFLLDIIFVFTSNQHPDELYKKGLQRELFLPFIELLKESSEVLELEGKGDYRLSHFKSMKTTFYTKQEGKQDFLQQNFNALTNNGEIEKKILHIKGRELIFPNVHGDILFTSFEEICGKLLGSADYLTIASHFKTILIADIPSLSVEIKDKIKRLIILIDALYDKNIQLICTAEVPIEKLNYRDTTLDFKRSQSRLIEMQTDYYFQGKNKA